MESTIYIVRHGQTNANITRTIQGQLIDEPLNATGLLQADAIGQRFHEIHVDAIYSSPLRRARQTADAIRALKPSVPYFEMSELMEMAWGILEGGKFIGENQRYFDRMEKEWRSGRYDDKVEGGESINDVLSRAKSAFNVLRQESEDKTVVVVTHGRFIRVLLATILDGYSLTRMDDLLHKNTAVSKLRLLGKDVYADYLQDIDHLSVLGDKK